MEQWGPTAVGGMLVLVIAALGAAWLKIQDSKNKRAEAADKKEIDLAKLEQEGKKAEAAAARKAKKDALDEYQELLESMRKERDNDRQAIHTLRNDLNAAILRMEKCEAHRRLQAHQIQILTEACRRGGIQIKPTDNMDMMPDLEAEGDYRD